MSHKKTAANVSSSSDDPHAAAFSLPSLQKVLVPFLVRYVGRRAQFLIRLHEIILRALRVSGKFAVVGLLRLIDFVVRADDHFLRGAQIPMALADVDHWALRCVRDAWKINTADAPTKRNFLLVSMCISPVCRGTAAA